MTYPDYLSRLLSPLGVYALAEDTISGALVQALGAYGRLASVGQPQFARHVPRALSNLLAAADEADLDALGGFVEDLIAKEEIRLGHVHHHHHHDEDDDEDSHV